MTLFFPESEQIPFVGEDICALAYQQADLERVSNSDAGSVTSVDAESPKLLERWEDSHVRFLIASYSKFKNLLGKGKTTKKEVFAKIANEFNSISEQQVADQCIRKWAKLEIKQKEVEDNNKQTGRARKSWKFHVDMTECIGSTPKVNPVFTFDTSSSSSGTSQDKSDESGHESEGDGESKKKKVKMPSRKRKSKSSAAEMLEFLHSYSEKKEKEEAEKLALLKSMKDEKKEFYSQFLEVLKNK